MQSILNYSKMETTFLVIFTLSYLFFQTFSASNTTITASSNVTCIQRERQSLLVFKQGLTDKSNRLSTWTGIECCEWHGVGCDRRNGHVVQLNLRSPFSFMDDDNHLKGKVSPSLLNLKKLRYLDLSMNNFLGQNIPEFFGSFRYLEYLNLSKSGFSGVVPPHLGNLSMLQYLDLNQGYEGSLTVKDDLWWLSLLSSLKHLDFSGITIGNHTNWFHPINMLPSLLTLNLAMCDINISSIKFFNLTFLNSLDLSSNSIPVWLSNHERLFYPNREFHSFHGGIPDSIGNLSSLSYMDLSNNELSGPIPDSIGNLSSLSHMYLSHNELSGPIPPSLGGLSSLRGLDISSNYRLSGSIPECIGQLSMLEYLDLSNNQLSGNIPTSLGQLSNLLHLDLWGNQMSGSIPTSLGQLSNLKSLYLCNNRLSGNIPTSLGQLSNLQTLWLLRNNMSGSIPASLGQLSNLQSLDLSRNQLRGSIPASLGQLSNLQSLELSINQLSGNIPTSLGRLSNLQELHLNENRLSGSIPTSLGQLSSLYHLSLSLNQLSGVVSEIHFANLSKLEELFFSSNSLTLNVSPHWIPPFQLYMFGAKSCNMGPQFPNWLQTQTNLNYIYLSNSSIRDSIPDWFGNISSNLQVLDLSYNEISGNPPPITNNEGLQIINLGKNHFSGSVPTYLCELLTIQVLDLSNNNFSGVLPKCLGNLFRLAAMDLKNNALMGVVPNSLGSIHGLRSLHLNNNKFEGNLPMALQNLISLVTFDLRNNLLTGDIPSWIGKKLSNLKILNFQSNKFMGKIPLELCQSNTLQHLNLANNGITGMIPRCFSNLTSMKLNVTSDIFGTDIRYDEHVVAYIKGIQLEYTKTIGFLISLDISNNKIIGEIPHVLMNLVELTNLNLSRNLLSGQIPETIGNLKKMESLDLSMNKLSGQIPSSLASLTFLSYLNLSFNNLTGRIPVGNQLQTLGDPSTIYEGNIGLCGALLSRRCRENNLLFAHGENERIDQWFYVGMSAGFVLGFLGLLGSLHFIRIWRVTYFEMVENVYAFLVISIIAALAQLRRKTFE